MASRTLRGTGTTCDDRVVDIGASYFTASDPRFAEVVADLTARGVVRAWTDSFHVSTGHGLDGVTVGPVRYAAPRGLRSVVQALVVDGVHVRSETSVQAVEATSSPTVDGESFDAVALCMPSPQARRILDGLPQQAIVWEPVIAVTCVFDRRSWPDVDGVFVNDDPVLTWIADDGSRRGDDEIGRAHV